MFSLQMKRLVLGVFVVVALADTASHTSKSPSPLIKRESLPVPGCTPVPDGDYTGDLRPQVHFSPPAGFMNDPNGCFVDTTGVWHLYYQYNPTGLEAGNQHWGHATSTDLYTWENQNIALCPDDPAQEQIFSGSIVTDPDNTSGFFPDQQDGVVAIYTLNTAEKETQAIAYSIDHGYSFTKYSGNPVLDIGSSQFRDPKVIRYNNDHWVMAIAYSQEFTVGIFTSTDLKSWVWASNFSHHGLLGLQWECPNLVQLPMDGSPDPMWLLAISINPGAPLGGSIMQYFPGSFDGVTFTPVDDAARIADFGKDNYAGQFFYGLPGNEDQVMIAWASNWQYCNDVPTDVENWRSTMSLPRGVRLTNVTRLGYDLVSFIYDLGPIRGPPLSSSTIISDGVPAVYNYSGVPSGALFFQVNASGIPIDGTATGTLNFNFSNSQDSISGGYFFGADTPFFVNRGGIKRFSDNPFFTDKMSTNSLTNPDGNFMLQGVIDRSILEVFLNGGDSSATTIFFPSNRLDTLTILAEGYNPNMSIEAFVFQLNGTWPLN